MLIKRSIFYDSDESEIRLPFHRSLSTFWNIFSGLCTQVFYSWVWVKGDVKSSCVVKLNVTQPQPKYKTRNFPNLRKRLLRDIT